MILGYGVAEAASRNVGCAAKSQDFSTRSNAASRVAKAEVGLLPSLLSLPPALLTYQVVGLVISVLGIFRNPFLGDRTLS